MAKRRTQNSDDRYLDSGDNPIGLTGAFAPVKGPQSVDYTDGDDPVGLTQAFGAIPDDKEERAWDEEGKWKDFDWNAGYETDSDAPAEDASSTSAGDTDDVGDAKPVANEATPETTEAAPDAAPAAKPSGGKGSGRGRHAAPEPELSPRMQKSRRTRRVLIVLVVLVVILIAVVAFFMYRTISTSQQDAGQQAQQQTAATTQTTIDGGASADAVETVTVQTVPPNLMGLFGKTVDEAKAELGRGAVVTSEREDTDDKTAIKKNVNIGLTEEPADSKATGTPTVYLGLDKNDRIIQVGYSASAGALGFGSHNFADAVTSDHIVEKTLAMIGVNVPEGSVTLPADKSSYATYAKDGTTVERERCGFQGSTEVNGEECTWSAVLSYDYKTQILTGNLSDTIRSIYVYVSQNIEPDPEESAPAEEPAAEGA